MKTSSIYSRGDFSLFGFTKDPNFLTDKVTNRLGITPRTVEIGALGRFFWYTTYGDVAETEEMVVLKLGLLHSAERAPLSAQDLLAHRLITPSSVETEALRGSALVACLSKTSPRFAVYKTVMSMPQLYFSQLDDGIICSDNPRPHLALLDQRTINEEAVVQHFLFRFVLGRHTHFKEMERILSGELFLWHDGRLETQQRRDYRPPFSRPLFTHANPETTAHLFGEIKNVMGAYLGDVRQTGSDFGNMISGGVDSTIIQLAINEHVPQPEQRKTFSYVMQTPRFAFETGYATEASRRLHTSHSFFTITPAEYGDLLVETIQTLTYPTPNEAYACKLGLARFIEKNFPGARYFFPANGADSSHGTSTVRKIFVLEKVRHIPAANLALSAGAAMLNSLSPRKAHGLREVAQMLAEINQPDSYYVPLNKVSVYSNIDMARRCFGDEVIKQALAYRRHLETVYLDSRHHAEKALMVGMVTDAYECGVTTNLIHLAHRSEQIYPFMDEDIVKAALAFDPNIRLLKGWQLKPLLKAILEQKSLGDIAHKPKGPSVFSEDLYEWLHHGPLHEMVLAIDRPGFLGKTDFEQLLNVSSWNPLDEPDWFLWNLLTFDIFQKHVVKAGEH